VKILFITDQYKIDPLGIAYLSAYLKAAGHDVALATPEEAFDPTIRYVPDPDMLCYSVTTGQHNHYLEVNRKLRAMYPKSISVFGGPHITFFPEFCQETGVDVGVRGEGFEAIVDIADSIEKYKPHSWEHRYHNPEYGYQSIENTVVGDRVNPLRPSLDKSTLLLPDRELIYQYPEIYNKPIKSIIASFQCIGQCKYCYHKKYKEMYDGIGVEIRPVEQVMLELHDMKRYPLKMVYFEDDVFPLYNTNWLDEFCKEYPAINKPFHIQLRVEVVKDAAIRRLKEVGLHSVTFAIESGNYYLRKSVLGRTMTDTQILDAAEIINKHDIKLRTQNMIGIPDETIETAIQTVELNTACESTCAWASLYQPYPGTELGERCIADGSYSGSLDDISPSFFDTYSLDVPDARKFDRLHKLFPLAVHNTMVRSLLPILIRLPLRRLYMRLYKWYKGKLARRLYDLEML
jgi:radical SAM superfamily enzyme YgiQ (UPF0313 family)